MASQSAGIQQLLTAEKRAAEKVAAARKRKALRLKQAKEEAQAEIEAYRKEREAEFREQERHVLGSRGDMESQVEQQTRIKMQEVNQGVVLNKEKCMRALLELVYDIKADLHQNYRG